MTDEFVKALKEYDLLMPNDAKIDIRVAELKADIIRWVFGIAVAQAGLILAVLRLFPAHP